MSRLTALLFLGSEGRGEIETQVASVRQAAALDAVELLAGLEAIERILLVTSERAWAEAHPGLPVEWDFDDPARPFHFGDRQAEIIQKYQLSRALYVGAGSIPLLTAPELVAALQPVGAAELPIAVTNNLHSSDWIAFNHADRLSPLAHRFPNDNSLGWVMKTEAGFDVRALPPSASTRLDIDTPADVLALGLQLALPSHLRAALTEFLRLHPSAWSRYRAAARTVFRPGSQIVLAGRVASAVWAELEQHTQSWMRVFSEERGMAASGRQAAGQARSLLAAHVHAVGIQRFFEELAGMAEAAFIDSRVILAHHQLWPSAADRYASDLGEFAGIENPFLQKFTQAAVEASFPVVLGGHGVVAGGLYALIAAKAELQRGGDA